MKARWSAIVAWFDREVCARSHVLTRMQLDRARDDYAFECHAEDYYRAAAERAVKSAEAARARIVALRERLLGLTDVRARR